MLLLACDFYYLKNIAGRRLVGLRWWNEADPATGDAKWVFESSDPDTRRVSATDKHFFWLALYVQPVVWIIMAILALVRLQFTWLPLVGESCFFFFFLFSFSFFSQNVVNKVCETRKQAERADVEFLAIALVLAVMNSLAFSRCDKFSQASGMTGSALRSTNLAGRLTSHVVGRWLNV